MVMSYWMNCYIYSFLNWLINRACLFSNTFNVNQRTGLQVCLSLKDLHVFITGDATTSLFILMVHTHLHTQNMDECLEVMSWPLFLNSVHAELWMLPAIPLPTGFSTRAQKFNRAILCHAITLHASWTEREKERARESRRHVSMLIFHNTSKRQMQSILVIFWREPTT